MFLFFVIFWLISVISSLSSDNIGVSLLSSVSYLRFLIFSAFFYWLIKRDLINFTKFYKILTFSLFIILFFCYFELLTGYNFITDNIQNIFNEGLKKPNTRITGLFGDEQVLGGFLIRFFLFYNIIYFYCENNLNKISKIIFLFFCFSIFIFIIFSGERSAIFLLAISLCLYFLFIKTNLKIKFLSLILVVTIFLTAISLRGDLYNRLITQTFQLQLYSKQENKIYFFSNVHEAHFKTAVNIFLKNPMLGKGNKSFRYLCSYDEYSYNIEKFTQGARKNESIGCATHPHNYYLQVLSENGILNFIILVFFYIYILFKLIVSKKNNNINFNDNYIISSYIFYAVLLWPIIPTGSFFSSWTASTLILPYAFLIIHNTKFEN